MTKYYFFKTAYIGGQGRLKLFALPGQQTMVRYNRYEALRTDVCVQTSREDIHHMIRFPEGTIFGVIVTGRIEYECKLKLYTRGDENYYRVEGLFPLAPARIGDYVRSHFESTCSSIGISAPEDLRRAYETFSRHASAVDSLTSTDFCSDEIAHIEAHLNAQAGITSSTVYDMILGISRAKDRMSLGICRFRFIKQNGDERTAYGTRSQQIIQSIPDAEAPQEQSNAQRDQSGGYFKYFDIQKKAWRQFCTENFRDVDTQYLERDAGAVPALG